MAFISSIWQKKILGGQKLLGANLLLGIVHRSAVATKKYLTLIRESKNAPMWNLIVFKSEKSRNLWHIELKKWRKAQKYRSAFSNTEQPFYKMREKEEEEEEENTRKGSSFFIHETKVQFWSFSFYYLPIFLAKSLFGSDNSLKFQRA